MDTLGRDIRFSVRTLLKNPGFTAIAVLALGLGIGASTAIFTIAYGLIWKPLPGAARADELVSLTLSQGQGFPFNLSKSSYDDYRKLDSVFSDTVAFYADFVQMPAEHPSVSCH